MDILQIKGISPVKKYQFINNSGNNGNINRDLSKEV
jgi:hypothetical protein